MQSLATGGARVPRTLAVSANAARRSVVTGGAGFIGSHLVEALAGRGGEVLVIDDLSTGYERNLAGVSGDRVRLEQGSIADFGFVEQAIGAFEPSTVFHLAAQADVRKAVADPGFDATVNVVGTANVLEASHRAGVDSFVLASTGGVMYGEGEGRRLPFVEDDPAEPMTPYGTSKFGAEAYVALYRRLYGLPGVALRCGNVYGPRQDPHGEAGVVAIFFGKLLEGGQPTVFGDGGQTRDYIYVEDVVGAFLAAGDALAAGQETASPINVGTGVGTSVLELLERICETSGLPGEPQLAPHRTGEIQHVSIDPARAGAELGWAPEVELDAGLAKTFEAFSAP
jgi:UDP-glucose 4-epimerase